MIRFTLTASVAALLRIVLLSAVLACGARAPRPSSPTGATVAAGLVAAYDMSSFTADGRLRDASANGLHALVHGTSTTTGRWGDARRFQSATDRVALPASAAFDLNGPLTIAVVLRYDRQGQHQHVLACDDKFALWLTPDDHVRFVDTLGDGVETADALPAGAWHSVVGVWRGTAGDSITPERIDVFIDGRRVTHAIVGGTPGQPVRWQHGQLYPTDACYIGFESHQGEPKHQRLPFFGDIDDVQIYARVWTQREVDAHAAAVQSR